MKNIFVAAITWVFFHELGHLMQEHGVIRAEFGSTAEGPGLAADIQDFEASGDDVLIGREAVVSHATELAADFEAMNFYVAELIRHVSDPTFASVEARTEVLAGLVYVMLCGLSLVFFRFNELVNELNLFLDQLIHDDELVLLISQSGTIAALEFALNLRRYEVDKNRWVGYLDGFVIPYT